MHVIGYIWVLIMQLGTSMLRYAPGSDMQHGTTQYYVFNNHT
jgi:hypothetical protein